ncbi:MAG: HAMP domain-containing sensor histidine kinase [Bacteroidia bacterium]
MPAGKMLRSLLQHRFTRLIAAVLCFSAAYLLTLPFSESVSPGALETETAIQHRELDLNKELDTLIQFSKGKSWTDIFKTRPARYNSLFKEKGFVLLIYEGDTLKFWSDNSTAVENYMKEVCLDEKMARLKNGWFQVVRKNDNTNRTYIGLSLVKNAYEYQNQYLVNDFWKAFRLPPETTIEIGTPQAANSIHAADGSYLFTLVFKQEGAEESSAFSFWLNVFLNIAGFIFVLLFLRQESLSIIPLTGKIYPHIIFVASVILLRYLTILIHFPETFYNSGLFSPIRYGDAESFWNSNLGDFFINALLLFYLSVYITSVIRKEHFRFRITEKYHVLFSALLISLPALCSWSINHMITGLVRNSDIAFNINNIFTLDLYSYIGLTLIGILLATFFIVTDRLLKLLLDSGISLKNILIAFIISGVLYTIIHHLSGSVDLIVILWPYIVMLLLIIWSGKWNEHNYSFSLIVLLMFAFSFYSTHMLMRQGTHKEHESRQRFAEKLAAEQDPVAEHLFTEVEQKIIYDTLLLNDIQAPLPDYSAFEKRIQQYYFSGYWDKYDVRVTFFDTMCTPLIVSSSPMSNNITHFEELIEKSGAPTFSENLFCLENQNGRISYLARLVLQQKGHEKFLGQGTLFVEFDSKLMSEEIGFPELLLDRELGINRKLVNYSYAKYKNGQLINHSGKYRYPLSPSSFGLLTAQNTFIDKDGWNHLLYKDQTGTIVILSKQDEGWLGKTTSFSYIFALFSLLLIFSLSLRQLYTVGPTFSNLSFKYRIQLVLVIIVLLSLTLFGTGSIYYIQQQYQTKNSEIISEKAHSVALEIESKFEENEITPALKDYATYVLKKFSNVFFTDINIYDISGNLYASSRPKVFEEGLVSRKMNPEAYLQVRYNERSEFIHDENIGNLAYLSAYLPLKNKNGEIQAYLNLPYFAKQSDLEKEISTFLVALINVYVLLFALAVLAAIFISNYLTYPLRLIQEKMRAVKLGKKNDPIEWKNKDEIGSLVDEYNRMISELAQSAELLAQSERESAWREMAKQVAHEIKNPLTPIRLSLQLLERAYKDKAPDLDQKVERLTKTMIEQIDTLSSIATAFSDFAKMPKAQNEKMDLKVLLQNVLELFRETSESISFEFTCSLPEALIYADKEQLIRVFNNLIRNAIQAIPEDRAGRVEICLSVQKPFFVVTVKDNGSGISEDVIDKIFVPNFTTKTAGMGLGLAMVKNIVETAGGRIWFETTKGAGTTFFVALPCHEENNM